MRCLLLPVSLYLLYCDSCGYLNKGFPWYDQSFGLIFSWLSSTFGRFGFGKFRFARESTLLGACYESLKCCLPSSSLSTSYFWIKIWSLDFLLLTVCLIFISTPPHHDGLLSIWNCRENKLFGMLLLAIVFYHSNWEVINIIVFQDRAGIFFYLLNLWAILCSWILVWLLVPLLSVFKMKSFLSMTTFHIYCFCVFYSTNW